MPGRPKIELANPATKPVTFDESGAGEMRHITRDRGRWYYVQRVPKQFAHLDPRRFVRIALRTDSETEARAKAPDIERSLWAYWEALDRGDRAAVDERLTAMKKIAQARGFAYRPAAEIATGPIEELVRRVEALERGSRLAGPVETAAILGAVEEPDRTIVEEMEEFLRLTKDRVAGKSEAQMRRYELTRRRTAADFVKVCGDKPLRSLTKADGVTFRAHWVDRVLVGGMNANTANKQIGHLSDLVKTLGSLRDVAYPNPFAGLRLHEVAKSSRVPFSTEWIRTKIAADGALAGLNEEARDVLLVMVNTGARPSEIINAELRDWRLGGEHPHLRIRVRKGQGLKTEDSSRDIPLLGVSLAAAKRIVERGGFARYAGDSSSWSAATTKYMTENGIREEPGCTPYSLRHSFEDRLLDAGCDERIRADLMGHKYARPNYGSGGRMPRVTEEIAKIAI